MEVASKLHMAIARVLASQSTYGRPFETPDGSPLKLESGDLGLEVHVGRPPDWLCVAIGRRRAIAHNILTHFFQGAAVDVEKCWSAPPDPIVDPAKHATSVTIVVRWTRALDLKDVPSPCWWKALPVDELPQWTDEAKKRFEPTLDLIERVLPRFLPNATSDRALGTRVLFARDESFQDAFSFPDESSGNAAAATSAPASLATQCLKRPEFSESLLNCLRAVPLPPDLDRTQKLAEALKTGRLRDGAGFLGKSEVLRDIQLEQVVRSEEPPVVAFIDMNGLKATNDSMGHEAGDRAIADFQGVLRRYAQNDLVYRDGGDEFVLLLRVGREQAVAQVREFLREVGATTEQSASIGLAFGANPSEPATALKERADKAMYKAKESSKIVMPSPRERPSAFCVEEGDVEFVWRSPPAGQ